MRQNQFHAILIFRITPTRTWRFAAYPHITRTQKAEKKKLGQKFIFQLGTLSHTESLSGSNSINLITNASHHISTNGKVTSYPYKNQQQPTIPLFALTKG